jgi:hypothetical protein
MGLANASAAPSSLNMAAPNYVMPAIRQQQTKPAPAVLSGWLQ